MINIEIKAKSSELANQAIKLLFDSKSHTFEYKGRDHQIDTYFKVPHGRLKLRTGPIENYLVQYDRPDQAGPKLSKVKLIPYVPGTPLKEALEAALGILVVVEKFRHIYYCKNVKIHLDHVVGLGHFIELEAQDPNDMIGVKELDKQCWDLMYKLDLNTNDLITNSYSDMLLEKNRKESTMSMDKALAVCTWGDGPDVLLTIHQGGHIGWSDKTLYADLSTENAKKLKVSLEQAIEQAEGLDKSYEDYCKRNDNPQQD